MASHGGPVIISRSSAIDTFYCDMNTRFIKLRYVDMRETIQNYFEKTSNILIITQMKILVVFVMILKRKLIRVYFLLRGKMKQICLYLKKNMDVDGEVEDKPIANSLKELINNMNVNPNIREKEENKCCL